MYNASLLIWNKDETRKAVIFFGNKPEYFKQQTGWQVSFVQN